MWKENFDSRRRFYSCKASYAIIVKDEHILLTTVKSTSKFWFPGGLVDDNESSEQALYREVYEETGVKIDNIKPLIEIESHFYFDHAKEARLQESTFYVCSTRDVILDKIINPDKNNEAVRPEWLLISELSDNNMQDYGYLVISEYLKSVRYPI